MKKLSKYSVFILILTILAMLQINAIATNDNKLYNYDGMVCDSNGRVIETYKTDTSGNIIDASGTIVEAEAEKFSYVSEVQFDSSLLWNIEYLTPKTVADYTENSLHKMISSEKEYDEIFPIAYVDAYGIRYTHTVDIDVIVSTEQNAVYKTLTFRSSDPAGLYFRDKDQGLTDKDGETNNGEASVTPDKDGKYHLLMTALFDGDFKIFAAGFEGIEAGEINICIVPAEADSEQNAVICAELEETVIEPTEYADGYTMKGCKEHGWFTRNNFVKYVQQTCEHQFNTYAKVPASYTAEGCTVSVCDKCGAKSYSDYTSKLVCPGHTGGKATCASKAICDICGQSYGETTGRHSFTTAACTEPSRCTVCGGFGGEALGHDWEVLSTSKATCTAGGGDNVRCRRCGITAVLNQTAPLGHDYPAMEYTVMPTCDTEGTRTAACRTCGNTVSETVPALGHNWADVTSAVHHDAVIQEVKVVDQAEVPGWDETQQVPICICRCGASFGSRDGWAGHASAYSGSDEMSNHQSYSNTTTTTTVHHEGTPEIYHMETVTVQEAYDETVTVGHTCTVCGASA